MRPLPRRSKVTRGINAPTRRAVLPWEIYPRGKIGVHLNRPDWWIFSRMAVVSF